MRIFAGADNKKPRFSVREAGLFFFAVSDHSKAVLTDSGEIVKTFYRSFFS